MVVTGSGVAMPASELTVIRIGMVARITTVSFTDGRIVGGRTGVTSLRTSDLFF